MPLQLPVLDDTDFEQLLDMALEYIDDKLQADWRAASEGDPGRVLIELFAYLTDQIIYRLNRLPEKVYLAFLRLLGVSLYPPTAAEVTLEFTPLPRDIPPDTTQAVEIPRRTRITTEGARGEGEVPVFVTLEPLEIPLRAADPDQPNPPAGGKTVKARHCTWVDQEELGKGSGKPGLTLQVAQPPIVAPFHRRFDLQVWVETDPDQDGRQPTDRTFDDRRYRQWQEVPNFSQSDETSRVYTVDRLSGTISFAPAARLDVEMDDGQTVLPNEPKPLAAAPGKDKHILVRYAHGGGSGGNVLPETLTAILDPVRLISQPMGGKPTNTPQTASHFVTVSNPQRADGGFDSETLANALIRGPLALYARDQAVTTRDYERIVLDAPGHRIARAKALTQAGQWTYAKPGTVEILLVPAVPLGAAPADEGATPAAGPPDVRPVSLDELNQWAQGVDLGPIEETLARSRALGTRHILKWTRYKQVAVKATIAVKEEVTAPSVVVDAVRQRLYQFINPFNDPDTPGVRREGTGWPLGRSLGLDEIEKIIKETPGVDKVKDLEMHFSAPNTGVRCLAPDHHQPRTWYASSHELLYRSTSDGEGWELMRGFEGETICVIQPNPDHAGLVALATHVDDPASQVRARVYVSLDCGETWTKATDFNRPVEDIGWLLRANLTILLLATDQGLYEFELTHKQGEKPRLDVPSLVPVNPEQPKASIYTLAVIRGQRGQTRVAAALKSRGGVWVSDGADLVPFSAPGLTEGELEALTPSLAPGTPGGPAAGEASAPSGSAPAAVVQRRSDSHFRRVPGLGDEDVRHLAAQRDGARSFLWVGVMAEGREARGCYRWQLGQPAGRWLNSGWTGGSCRALAFDGGGVFAATQWDGILKLDLSKGADVATWQPSTQRDTKRRPRIPESFLRFLDDQRGDYAPDYQEPALGEPPAGVEQLYRPYEPLWIIAVGPSGTLMASSEHGILRRVPCQEVEASLGEMAEDAGDCYEESSAATISKLTDWHEISIPYDWLFVSGDHQIKRDRAQEEE
jgi:hypothetical protein